MARLMSQVKGGYYAAAPEAVAAVLERLRPPNQGDCLVLDCCAGEGKALLQLAQGLKAVPYGIELSEDRATLVRKSLPGGQALAPADFLRCAISYRSFSFIWCNPPYDYATGEEGRVESQFLERAVHLLADGGVLALICPEDMANSYQTVNFFQERFRGFRPCRFPKKSADTTRPSSWATSGRTRPPTMMAGMFGIGSITGCTPTSSTSLPPGERPRQFRKSEPTDVELARLVAQSPLRFHLQRPADKANYRPGHR